MGIQQNFFLAVTLAAAASTTALGQTPTPTVGSVGNGKQNAAAVPDFSGHNHRDADVPRADRPDF
jgi:hypothetical protein